MESRATRRRKSIRTNLIILTVAVFLGICIYLWYSPLGPSLEMSTYASVAAGGRRPISIDDESSKASASKSGMSSGEILVPQSVAPYIPKGEPFCGGPPLMYILLIGSDYRGEGYLYGLADAIRIVRIDFTIPDVSVLDFPRDLWVEIPDIADHYGITHGKLNQAYFFGTPGMGYYDGPGKGAGLLARTLYQNFDVPVDHYMTLTMQALLKAVDAVGGVDITFEKEADLNAVVGPTYPHLLFPPGTYHFNGELAVHLSTSRKPSTFQRTRYQNMLIFALRDKLMSTEMLPKLPGLALSMVGETQTDLSPDDISELICIANMVTEENIRLGSFPQELFTGGSTYDEFRKTNTYTDLADFEQLRSYVMKFAYGSWPTP
jgi:LCP family protein required for cell wall assembly